VKYCAAFLLKSNNNRKSYMCLQQDTPQWIWCLWTFSDWLGWEVNFTTPQPCYPTEKAPSTHCTGGCVDPIAKSGFFGEKIKLLPLPEIQSLFTHPMYKPLTLVKTLTCLPHLNVGVSLGTLERQRLHIKFLLYIVCYSTTHWARRSKLVTQFIIYLQNVLVCQTTSLKI
jgi:hypothetical protein